MDFINKQLPFYNNNGVVKNCSKTETGKVVLEAIIKKAKFTNQLIKVSIEDDKGIYNVINQIVDSTANYIFFSNGKNVAKRFIKNIEILS